MNFIEMLSNEKISLIVSLPKNDLELAEAAISGGADCLKVHVNVKHKASGSEFKSLKEELPKLKNIIELSHSKELPIGIVAGGSPNIPMNEIKAIKNNGFDFISLYHKHMNPLVLKKNELYSMVAIDSEYNLDLVRACNDVDIDVLECSIIVPERYGQPLTVKEILQYKSIRNSIDKPIVIPTQLAVKPEHVEILSDIGVNGIMIGAVVTGKDKRSLYAMTTAFRESIDKKRAGEF